jgi:hypothetical protein
MRNRALIISTMGILLIAAYTVGNHSTARANTGAVTAAGMDMGMQAAVPKAYGRLAAVLPDSIGTGLVFEDKEGTIRFVSVTGMKEGELARYDDAPVHGGIPRAYGHLAGVVVNHGATGLVFEDDQGVIRLVTLAGVTEQVLTRN